MSLNINSKEYKIKQKLGEGGYGKVYLVLNESDNEFYALKEFPINGEAKENIQLIKKEAEILSKFNHKNIVKYYDSLEIDDKFYILMEYCDGKNLNVIINEYKENNQLIEEKKIYNIIKQICLGIKEIHDKKIVHRDLKPENIFMNKNDEIKIGDFGISKELNLYKTYTKTTKKVGTLYYAAPEILDDGIYNDKADIYSLGCIIYELFHLNVYFLNYYRNNVKKIDDNIYNQKWQELIDLLLQNEYDNRPDINKVIEFISSEDLKHLDEDKNDFEILDFYFEKIDLEIKQNKIEENNNKNFDLVNSGKNEINKNEYNLDNNIEIIKIKKKLSKAKYKKIRYEINSNLFSLNSK